MGKRTTKIVSFRLPVEKFEEVDSLAAQQGTIRSELVKDLFTEAFERLKKQQKSTIKNKSHLPEFSA